MSNKTHGINAGIIYNYKIKRQKDRTLGVNLVFSFKDAELHFPISPFSFYITRYYLTTKNTRKDKKLMIRNKIISFLFISVIDILCYQDVREWHC